MPLEIELTAANQELAPLGPLDRIRWARERFGKRLVLTTSFGTYSAVMLHLTQQAAPEVPVLSIDTGHTEETRAFADKLIEQLKIEVATYSVSLPESSDNGSGEIPRDVLSRAKVETLEKALADFEAEAWMSGVMRSDTKEREGFDFLIRRVDGLYKFHPILDWNNRMMHEYCQKFGLPTNDTYFDPLKGKDQKWECGIHLTGLAAESLASSQI